MELRERIPRIHQYAMDEKGAAPKPSRPRQAALLAIISSGFSAQLTWGPCNMLRALLVQAHKC